MEAKTGSRFAVDLNGTCTCSFQRTLRLPDDGRAYPLPPGLGALPVYRAADYPEAPEEWRRAGDFFVPMYLREALWIGIQRTPWKPAAVQVGLGDLNAISGLRWTDALSAEPQNYLVCPPQLWLDGVNAGEDHVRQFVAVTANSGQSIEAQVLKSEEQGGLRLLAFEPMAGRFPDSAPPPQPTIPMAQFGAPPPEVSQALGLGAGGTMRQRVYRDPYGIDTWQQVPAADVRVHLLHVTEASRITGEPPPPSPADAAAYTRAGLPWFELYDEDLSALPQPKALEAVRSLKDFDKGLGVEGDIAIDSIEIPPDQVWRLK